MVAATPGGGDVAGGYGDLPGLGPDDHVVLKTQGFYFSDELYHMKNLGIGEEIEHGLELIDTNIKLQQVKKEYKHSLVLNLLVRASLKFLCQREERSNVINVINVCHREEQLATILYQPAVLYDLSEHAVLAVDPEGVVYHGSPTEPTALRTQESINFRKDKLKAVMEEEPVFQQAHNSSDESEDAYDSDNNPFSMEEHVDQDEDSHENSDEEQLHYEDEQEEEVVNFSAREEPAKRRKKLEVRKGPSTRSHSSVLEEVQPDFIPSSDEEGYCLLFEDEDDGHEPPSLVLPKGRKSRAKKRKPRMWYNDKLEQPREQLCLYMYFKDQHQFREALLSFHITQSQDFRYHRNSDQRITACCKQDHCQFCIVVAVIKGEKTFAIKKMRLEHTCPTNTEKSRISAKWLAKTYESLFRSHPRTSIHTLINNCREKYGVDVARHMAYRAKNLVVEAVLGEHKKQT
ncbi:hypothetical protein D1007_13653 [Hordeum vulgare]|nr:hypothetical protein D1007_13653 [Hordeum vulgare]